MFSKRTKKEEINMNLGELKMALAKFPPDMDDTLAVIQTGYSGKEQYDLPVFVGTISMEDKLIVVIGTLEAARILVKNKKLKVPDDYVPGGEDDTDIKE
jgi:hypothetical protein